MGRNTDSRRAIIRRIWIGILALVLLLSGCAGEIDSPHSLGPTNLEFSHVEPAGTVPEEFKVIAEENLFRETKTFADRLLVVNREEDRSMI